MKYKLSKKSKSFVTKLKAQSGLQVPYQDNYEFDYNQPIHPDFASAYNQASKGILGTADQGISPVTKPKGQDLLGQLGSGNLPFVSNLLKGAFGVSSLIQSAQEKKRQQAYERITREDLKRRKEEARANNFYMTPYTTGRSDDLTLQLGGQIPPMDRMAAFTEYYNTQEDKANQLFNQIKQGYEQKNESLKQEWKQRKSQGFSDLISGGIGLGTEFLSMQKGGKVKMTIANKPDSLLKILERRRSDHKVAWQPIAPPELFKRTNPLGTGSNKSKSKDRFREKQLGGEIDPTEDLYSDQFVSPWEQQSQDIGIEEQLQNKVQADNPGLQFELSPDLTQWLFQEDPVQNYTISDIYNSTYSSSSDQNQELPIQSVLDKFSQMGIKPSSVNTGQHNIGSKHYHGKALDLGLNTSFGGDVNKMNEFYNYLTSAEGKKQFPNIIVRDERTRPANQKVWTGSHLHIELK